MLLNASYLGLFALEKVLYCCRIQFLPCLIQILDIIIIGDLRLLRWRGPLRYGLRLLLPFVVEE